MQLKQQLVQMASMIDSEKGTTMASDLQQAFTGQPAPNPGTANVQLEEEGEHPFNERSREQANAATQVNE